MVYELSAVPMSFVHYEGLWLTFTTGHFSNGRTTDA
jgi:hypothetical protein